MADPANVPDQPDQHPATSHGPEHLLERLIFFSDAVFAIAITLLVIELHIPRLPQGASDLQFIEALLALTPNFIGFIISFFVIGAFWSGHHRAFGCAAHWDERLIMANILLLFAIAAMPFFSALISEYSTARVPVVAYCCWLLLTALLSRRLQLMVTAPPIVGAAVSLEAILRIRRRSTATILGAVSAILVGMFATKPVLAQIMLISIPFWRMLIVAVLGKEKPIAAD